MDERKQPTVALCVIFVAVLPLLYFLSIGPAFWAFVKTEKSTPEWIETAFDCYVAPAEFAYEHYPAPIQHVMEEYLHFFDSEA